MIKVLLGTLGAFFVLLAAVFLIAGITSVDVPVILTGFILMAVGAAPFFALYKMHQSESSRPIHYEQRINIEAKDLVGGEKGVRSLECRNCSGPITASNVRFTDMGMIIDCPYCGSVYSVEEAPKW